MNKDRRLLFVIFGILFFLFSALFCIASIIAGKFPTGDDIILFSISVMAFCIAYLYPQFKENDERTKRIKEKGMFVSYFFIIGYMVILMGVFQMKIFELSGYQTVSLLASLTIITVFSSFVVFSKRI